MNLLEVQNLSVNYGDKNKVNNCSFLLNQGEILVILGSSGDGKTTLLKSIAGLLKRAKGTILFENEPVLDPSEKLVPGHPEIKLINQDFDLNEFHTVEENIRLRLLSFDEEYQAERLKTLLRLTKLTAFRNKKANEISGGQKQRLAIARALADEPKLMLLDEPFNQLDFQTKSSIASAIKRYLKKNNIASILVTHNGIEAMEWADRILFIDKGKLVRNDTPEAFFNAPTSLKEARFFGEINKVELNGKNLYFRPSFYSQRKNKEHTVKIDLIFKGANHLGWYSAFFFQSGKYRITLYSTKDISSISFVFIRLIEIND